MKVWTVTDFPGVCPVGFAAVIVAPHEEMARILFEAELLANGLALEDSAGVKHKYTLERLKDSKACCQILVSGDY